MRFFVSLALLMLIDSVNYAAEPTFTPQQLEFFEAKVRPLLIEKCQSCHGEKKQHGDLRLDSRERILKGGDTGASVNLQQPEKSLLLHALAYPENGLQMPPKGKLPQNEIEILTQWVKLGVPYPASQVKPDPNAIDPSKHWAFQPVRSVNIPQVRDEHRLANPIDAFVLKQLETKSQSLAPLADARTLIRRVYYDLIGLPPTQTQIEAFENDRSPDAFERLVDSLLASPQYGERWARHWLDLARYSDTKGYVFQEDRNYPFAYTYRDWVIRSLNEDLPYDQFVVQQLAADRLDLKTDPKPLAAMGFLTVGRRFLNNTHDIIDDRIDTVTRTFLGLTVTCARCHDHKFDPIPTKDYYSLYGIFASTVEPKDLPLIGEIERNEQLIAFEKELQKREAERDQFIQKRHFEKLQKLREAAMIEKYLIAMRDTQGDGNRLQAIARERDLAPLAISKWRELVYSPEAFELFAFIQGLSQIPDAEWGAKYPQEIGRITGSGLKLFQSLIEALSDRKIENFNEVARIYSDLLVEALQAENPTPDQKKIRDLLLTPNSPLGIPVSNPSPLFDRADRNQLTNLQKQIDGFKATSPASPPRAMVLNEAPNLFNPYVFVRGNPGNRGANVPRQFLQVVAGENRKPFTQGSGRLEMAQAIANASNPLTARVMVNRLWLNHFGYGLVRTPSDFGVRCEPPTHPELLDYLAGQFVQNGWSLKRMHKLMLMSQTYRQSSDCSEASFKLDPENRLLGRANRKRLDFEELRDSLLHVSGSLNPKLFGKSVDLFIEPFTHRRTLYGFIDRQNLPGTFRAFDFASPDTHSPQRFNTTVPQQALFLLNSPFTIERAKQSLLRPEMQLLTEDRQKVRQLYRQILAREATPEEIELALQFIHSPTAPLIEEASPSNAWAYGYGRFDEATQRVSKFTRLAHFSRGQWRGSEKLPDPKIGWCLLFDKGGHPGENPDFAIIRRFTVPLDGIISLQATLEHVAKQGDGVRARVVSSEKGELGKWEVAASKTETKLDKIIVKKGETLDFVVDCRGGLDSDSFFWAPVLNLASDKESRSFDAARDFRGLPEAPRKSISNWDRLAQVLLLSNEFAFID